MTRRTYQVDVSRDGRWWLIRVPELDTVGQARTLAEVNAVARDVIGLWLDAAPDSFDIAVTVATPAEAAELWHTANTREEAARAAAAAAARLRREAVTALTADGISKTDAARLLGVSKQRVSQLTHG